MGTSVRLGELFNIKSSKRVLKSQWRSSGVPFYRGREITALSLTGQVNNELFIDEEFYQEFVEKYGAPACGDIVVTAIGTIGNSYVVKERDRFYFKDASVLWLQKKVDVVPDYINYWFQSPLMKAQLEKGNGATVDTLSIGKLKSLELLLPSIREQKRIVAILDEAFADIEKARALTERNLENARELFESYLLQAFSSHNKSWEAAALENVVSDDCALSYGIVQPGESYNDGLPVVRPTDLVSEVVDGSNLKRINPEKAEGYKRTKLKGGELLVCVRGTTGTISIAANSLAGANVTRGIVPIRFNPEIIDHRFGYYQFSSPLIKKQIAQATYGAALMQINIKDLRQLKVSVPPLSEQDDIVKTLDAVKPDLSRAVEIYTRKLEHLDELKKSLLQKAFTGYLMTN